ncbi:MAG: FAD-dependent oxidoreductase [Aquabacterium sp.]|jgi:NADH dehydrogenase|nr:MAG: FAD-dependent oxidoreductase [Aquabacterium sp.]
MPEPAPLHRILIVGGGAGGLELATRLGDRLGKSGQASIVLLDQALTHVWKPLLHEVAAGNPALDLNELDFLAQARRHHFEFQPGRMTGLDRANRQVLIAPLVGEDGVSIAAARSLPYDTLVLAVGSLVNDFDTPGVKEHALPLNDVADARRFHRRLLAACAAADLAAQGDAGPPPTVHIVVVGGGATGVELAAELRQSGEELALYRIGGPRRRRIDITVVEAAPRLVGALSEQVAQSVRADLERLGVKVETGERVVEITAGAVRLGSGRELPSTLTVWAAGIRAPGFLARLEGLETGKLGQLVVTDRLQATQDADIFAFGDCAAVPMPAAADGKPRTVPPLAQAAHQQGALLAENLQRRLRGLPLRPFVFRDRGSIISLAGYTAVGSVAGVLTGRRYTFEGWTALVAYRMLYRSHLVALYGIVRTLLLLLSQWLGRHARPTVKLH